MVHHSPQTHFLLVSFPAQGLINPSLQFAKQLVSTGAHVTLTTCVSAHRRMAKNLASLPKELTLVPFSDGYDDGWEKVSDIPKYMSEIKCRGVEALTSLVLRSVGERRPITSLIYTLLVPWASDVARKFELPSAVLWVQPAAVFDVYYYYFNGYRDRIVENIDDPDYSLELPGLPLLKAQDLPSFFHPSNYLPWFGYYEQQFELLSKEMNSCRILVNTFDELEPMSLKAVEKLNLIAIGPLIPSAFLDGKDPSDKSFGGDFFTQSKDYIEWLDSNDKSSVVYVSFGSLTVLSSKQMEELARGLVDSKRPFLWVIRAGEETLKEQEEQKHIQILREEHKGMIVPWCSQVEVLAHESIGCFVTHCGWNSTLETLAMGVPVVAFPQWTDQFTNAKLIEDVWKMGVRVNPNEEKIVESGEIMRCLDEVMKREELRENAEKWKDLAREAVREGGSSEKNLRKFVDEMSQS